MQDHGEQVEQHNEKLCNSGMDFHLRNSSGISKFKREPVEEAAECVVLAAAESGEIVDSRLHRQDKEEDPIVKLAMEAIFLRNRQEFDCLVDAAEMNPLHKRGCVVLDLFAGIGTTVVALKRLGISLDKVIHCEVDKVATHVYTENHGPASDETLVHVDRFEEIFQKDEKNEIDINNFMEKHGPIDIVVAGPPCQDFSGVNASRKRPGRHGEVHGTSSATHQSH